MVFNAIFNIILIYKVVLNFIDGRNEVPEETDRPTASHRQTLSHNGASRTPRHELDSNSQR